VAVVGFVADKPGRVEITWQGWQIDTSAAVLAVMLIAAVAVLSALIALIGCLLRWPRNRRGRRAARRRLAGDAAVTRGLVALAAGDVAAAQREAARAEALLDGAPVPLLLAAEAARQQGDRGMARQFFAKLLERPETEFLGLRGLLGEALKSGDDSIARRFAERARELCPGSPWLADSVLALQARAADWSAAGATIADASRRKILPAARTRHGRGVVLYQQSREAESRGDLPAAAALAARAQALLPDLAEPAAHHARLLLALQRVRAARRAIERAWRTTPHPDLARIYLDTKHATEPLAKAAALQLLAEQNPEALESHLAVAEAALNAQLWGEARRHLRIAAAAAPPPGPTRLLCLMMARLEDSEPGDPQMARNWLERAAGAPPDPCYVCAHCNAASPEWYPVCGKCGGFDTFAWHVPERAAAELPAPASAMPLLPAPEAASPGEAARALARPRQSAK
jgi:HemY protein